MTNLTLAPLNSHRVCCDLYEDRNVSSESGLLLFQAELLLLKGMLELPPKHTDPVWICPASSYPCPHTPSPQLLQQRRETSPVKQLVLLQHAPDFFHQRRANHLHCFLPRISCRQEPLERLPRLGRITGTNLVLHHLQDRRLQVRIEWRFLLV